MWRKTSYLLCTLRHFQWFPDQEVCWVYLVDYDALAKVLEEQKIMGAALEVFPTEPIPADSPFLRLDNVTLTNHRGGDTVNCYSDSPEYLLTALEELLENGKTPQFYID